jgi:ribosomal protein S18 acetylase RimI-like enzyme
MKAKDLKSELISNSGFERDSVLNLKPMQERLFPYSKGRSGTHLPKKPSASKLTTNDPLNSHASLHLPVSHRIREIDPSERHDVATIARMHLKLLWWGPIAQLGELFLRQVCYTILVRKGLMRGALFEVHGKPAGFIAYTDRSITFHRTAIGQHLFYAAYWTLVSVIRDPWIVLRLWGALRLMFSRWKEKEVREDPLAEIVAMGVLPEYRTPAFNRRTGLRISEELVKHAAKYFREVGISKIRMIVDSDNKPALLFYHSLGCSLDKYQHSGRDSVQCWLNLDREPNI